jgi:hypothetical protein
MLLASSMSAHTQQPRSSTCPQHTTRCGQQESSTSYMQLEYYSARLLILLPILVIAGLESKRGDIFQMEASTCRRTKEHRPGPVTTQYIAAD